MKQLTGMLITGLLLCVPPSAWAQSMNAHVPRWEEHDQGKFQKKRGDFKAFREQKQNEHQEFLNNILNLPPEERQKAIEDHFNEQEKKNAAFREKVYQKRLTEFQARHEKRIARYNKKIEEAKAYMIKIVQDDSLTPDEKREKIREYRQSHLNQFKGKRPKGRQGRKTEREDRYQENRE